MHAPLTSFLKGGTAYVVDPSVTNGSTNWTTRISKHARQNWQPGWVIGYWERVLEALITPEPAVRARPLAHTCTEFRVNSELSGGRLCDVTQSLGPPLMAAPEGVRICARVARNLRRVQLLELGFATWSAFCLSGLGGRSVPYSQL